MIRNLAGETLSIEILSHIGSVVVEWLELLLLRHLGADELVVEDLELELNGITAGL